MRNIYSYYPAKLLLVVIILFASNVYVFAFDNHLEPLLLSTPNIEATEYTLILHNKLAKTLSYLDTIEVQINNSREGNIQKQIRKAHIYYLRAFAYAYHKDSSISKAERNRLSQEEIKRVLAHAEPIIISHPYYSDILRVAAVSTMLYGKTGASGIINLMNKKQIALDMVQRAILLNPENMMARVVLNNFDSLAPKFAGANIERGLEAISKPLDVSLPSSVQFEVLMSRYYAYKRNKDGINAKKVLADLRNLYPKSWRLQTFLD